jgi:uncharacterized protein (TIGR02996 family)
MSSMIAEQQQLIEFIRARHKEIVAGLHRIQYEFCLHPTPPPRLTMHPDRVALLRAILAEPGDNVRRLAYSDWLEEHSTDDRDIATVEFIRASCSKASGERMPKAAYTWLKTNWRRLLPALCEKMPAHVRQHSKINGRTLHLVYTPFGYQSQVAVVLEFWRGFLARVSAFSIASFQAVEFTVWTDQPLAGLNVLNDHDYVRVVRYPIVAADADTAGQFEDCVAVDLAPLGLARRFFDGHDAKHGTLRLFRGTPVVKAMRRATDALHTALIVAARTRIGYEYEWFGHAHLPAPGEGGTRAEPLQKPAPPLPDEYGALPFGPDTAASWQSI